MANLKKLIIASALLAIFSSTQIHAANPGDPITAINFGEYASFGGSIWQKARYYDHDNFISTEQGYFIRHYDNNYVGAYHASSNVFATSTLETSILSTFYANMANTNNIKTAISDTNWSTGASTYVNGSTPGILDKTSYHISKIAIPSTWEVANNSEIFSAATPNFFWLRTLNATYSYAVWLALSSTSFTSVTVVNREYRVLPSLKLLSTVQICSGNGTISEPYILTNGMDNCPKPGNTIDRISYGEYVSFGGSNWRKARYYNHDNFISSEQGYFIRLYDDNYYSDYRSDNTTNDFAVSTLINSTLSTFYTNMANTNNIKTAISDTNWSTGASTYVNSTSPGNLTNTSYHNGKVAIPSTWEVANNSEIFNNPTANYYWLRTPFLSYSYTAWIAKSSSIFDGYASVGNDYRVLPSLRLLSSVTIISGDGTSDNPYVLSYSPYMINISNADTDIVPTKSSPQFTISGTIDYPDDGDATSVAVSATIGGISRSINVPISEDMSWQLSWSYNELTEGEHTNIEFTATSNSSIPEETSSTYAGKVIIDKTVPTCGTWSPSESAWKISGAASFTLTSSTDTGGSGVATESASLTCSTGPVHGDTCFVTIFDQAGNDKLCTSPNNRVDIFAPNLSVTPAIQGWQGDKQDIIITSIDDETSVNRIAYAWDINTLGADCSGGTTLTSGDNIRLTIAGGANPLFVCASDIAGNVASFSDIYSYTPPVFAKPHLAKNATTENLYWNIESISETQSYVEIKGFFLKTTGSYNYSLEYIVPTINKSYAQALRTSPFSETHFTFIIPTTDFKASKDNHTFSGPQKLKITDLDQMEATTIDHNLSFFFPIHQTNHRTSFNYFIFASDNRLNEVGE